jgi:cytochrome P450
MAKMFDTSLRLDAPGPGGPPLVNNPRFLSHPEWYALDWLAPISPGPVLAVTRGNGSLAIVRGEEAVRRFFTDNHIFHRPNEGIFDVPSGRPWSKMFESIGTLNGERRRRANKLLMPVVHKRALEHYRDVFVRTFEQSKLARPDGEGFDLAAECLAITKVNMLTCLLGLEPDSANMELAGHVTTLLQSMLKPPVLLFQVDRSWRHMGDG